MKKKLLILSLIAFAFSVSLNAEDAKAATSNESHEKTRLRDEIMEEDQNESSDTLAIPLDQSDVEDEELIDRMEGKPFTPVPPPQKK